VGVELNMVSVTDTAGAFVFYYGYALSPRFTIGAKLSASTDFRGENALETAAFLRWNLKRWGILPDSGLPRLVLFVQAGIGAGYYTVFEYPNPARSRLAFLGEGGLGLRWYVAPIKGRPFFVEPFVRYAYSSGPGIGIVFGI
jgi:hypothetical protein